MTHALLRVMNSTPIDRTAYRVASQRNVSEFDHDVSREDLIHLVNRLRRKHQLMKSVLQIKNESQHANVVSRYRAGAARRSKKRPARLIAEYVRVGDVIQVLCRRIAEINARPHVPPEVKALRKRVGAIENAWREAHPGCIWDGRQLVAPNGAVFSRSAVEQEAANV